MPRQRVASKASQLLSIQDARVFSHLPVKKKIEFIKELSDAEAIQLKYLWEAWARDNQLPPEGSWSTFLMMGGRGSGKTRAGAEWIRKKKETSPYLHLIGRTAADVRDVMVDGESGILAISPPWDMPEYQRSKRRLVWPNGAQAITFSADEPESLRGPQCFGMWLDEIGSWRFSLAAYDMALFGLRLGKNPQAVCTTTPRATPLVKRLLSSPLVKVSRSTTYDNRANLAEAFFSEIIKRYENTRLGRQELEGLLIEDSDEALWKREEMIEQYRVLKYPHLKRIAVAIDPAVTSGEESNETGIIVGGVGIDGHAYILEDASMRASPHAWASQAIAMYYKYKCDRMIAEGNQGGELIENTIRTIDRTISFKRVHARHGKYIRAEPVAALYEKGMVHHVGAFPFLEDELCQWVQGEESPNHLDALVWLLTELMLHSGVYASTVMDELAERRVAREKFNKERAEQYW